MKNKMKAILLILSIAFLSCGNYNPSNPNNIYYVPATEYQFSKLSGKTIRSMTYIENAKTIPGCDDLVVTFTDGKKVKFHVQKYLLEVSE